MPLPLIFILVGGVAAYFLFGKEKVEATDETSEEYNKAVDKKKLSYSQADYNSMSDMLFVAMTGGGTDDDAILAVIDKLLNPDDWKFLVATFGVKQSDSMLSSFSGNLYEWLNDELSDSPETLDRIKAKLKSIGTFY